MHLDYELWLLFVENIYNHNSHIRIMNFDDFSSYLEEQRKIWNCEALGVSIVSKDDVLFKSGFGLRDMDQNLPFNTKTVFPIASHSKSFTATAMAMLVNDGIIDWDTPIRKYYPKFKLFDSYASEKATIRDLLAHTFGLAQHQFSFYNSEYTYRDVVNRIPHFEPILDFRVKHSYCNQNFVLASLLVEELNDSGKDYFSFVQSRILDPLEMKETIFSTDEMYKLENHCKGYSYETAEKKFKEVNYPDIQYKAAGAGCINSTLEDMNKWIQFHLNKGNVKGDQLIDEKILRDLYQIQRLDDPQKNTYEMLIPGKNYVSIDGYALGWSVIDYRCSRIIRHFGTGYGIFCNTGFMPNEEIGFVLFSNTTENYLPLALDLYISDKYRGLDPVDWSTKILQFVDMQEKNGKAKKIEAEKAEQERTIIKPSYPLDEYVGKYYHPGYGTLEFFMDNKGLKVNYGKNSQVSIKHYDKDTYRITIDKFMMTKNVTFITNTEGKIDSLEIDAEPKLKPTIFTKKD